MIAEDTVRLDVAALAFAVRLPVSAGGSGRAVATAPAGSADTRHYVEEAARWVTEGAALGPEDPGQAPDDAPRVLVVDDNADMRRYLASLLSSSYRLELAVDGVDALAKAHATVPDLVLTDVMMPNLDGFALLAELRRSPVTAGVPVIMLSARAGEVGVADALSAGAAGAPIFFEAPFRTADGGEVLMEIVGEVIRDRRASRWCCAAPSRTSASAGAPSSRSPPMWPPGRSRPASTRSPRSCRPASFRAWTSIPTTWTWRPTTGPASRAPRSAATGTTSSSSGPGAPRW